jgi:CRP-like cAMP-binding protein
MGTVRLEARLLRSEDLPGGFLDVEPYLRGGKHVATVRAEETCFLAVIGANHREAFLRGHPALVLQVLEAPAT